MEEKCFQFLDWLPQRVFLEGHAHPFWLSLSATSYRVDNTFCLERNGVTS